MRNEFWTVIAPNVVRLTVLPDYFLHESDQARRRYGMGDFLCNGDTVAIIDNIKHTEFTIALQNVSNEVHRPCDIFLVWSHKWILDSGWQALAQRFSPVEMNRLVDTVDFLMVPRMAILTNQPVYFPEALVGDFSLLPDRSLNLGIVLGRIGVDVGLGRQSFFPLEEFAKDNIRYLLPHNLSATHFGVADNGPRLSQAAFALYDYSGIL